MHIGHFRRICVTESCLGIVIAELQREICDRLCDVLHSDLAVVGEPEVLRLELSALHERARVRNETSEGDS